MSSMGERLMGSLTGVELTKLKKISHPKGDIFHALKSSENSFSGFGEAYFSSVNGEEIKGWKKHTQMVMNLIVPVGTVMFYIYDDVLLQGWADGRFRHHLVPRWLTHSEVHPCCRYHIRQVGPWSSIARSHAL